MTWVIHHGDWVERLCEMQEESVNCVVTSPPYWGLRDYGVSGQLGLERTPEEYIAKMVEGFREVRRVLRSDGTLWLNLGDSYTSGGRADYGSFQPDSKQATHAAIKSSPRAPQPQGLKPKDLVGIPWMLAFALRADGWYLRQDIIWAKPNPMPESVTDRCTKSHEYLFLLSRSPRYYFNQEAILEDVSPNTHARLAQDVEAQIGSERANGGQKTNGNMKAVARKAAETPRNDGGRWNENDGRGFPPRSWHGSEFHTGKTGEHQLGRSSKNRKLAPAGDRYNRSNESFSNAVCCLVEKRNKRSVWEVTTQGYSEAHFATFPPKLVEPCILAGCPEGGTVLDPFAGAGTTGLVALRYHRNFIGIELKQEYCEMARRRIEEDAPLFNGVSA